MSEAFSRIRSVLIDLRALRAIVGFVGSAVLLYLAAIFWFGWQEALAAFAALGLPCLLIGAALSSSSYLWRFLRWEYALRRLGHELPRSRHLSIYLSGLALTTTPGKFGETFRSALLLPHGVRLAHSLAAFLVDRASDVLGMCLLGGLASWGTGQSLAWIWFLSFVGMLASSCALAYAVRHPRSLVCWQWARRSLAWLPLKGGQAALESWAEVWRVSRVMAFSIVALLAYGTQALIFAWFCRITETGLAVAECVLIFVQATLFGAASLLPGGLGAMEAALVVQLTGHGVAQALAVSLAIAIRLVTLWVGMLLGAVFLLRSAGMPLKRQ